jgi:hypothetical protein
MWFVLDDAQFADAIGIVITKEATEVLADWRWVEAKLADSPDLLAALLYETLHHLTFIDERIFPYISGLPLDVRQNILYRLKPLPKTHHFSKWWEERVLAFRLLLQSMAEVGYSWRQAFVWLKTLAIFEDVDPVLLMREFRAAVNDGVVPRGGKLHDWVDERLKHRLFDNGYNFGKVSVGEVNGGKHRGDTEYRVFRSGIKYVRQRSQPGQVPAKNDLVAFPINDEDVEVLVRGVIAVPMYILG